MPRVAVVVGTRPEAIKMAPVIRELQNRAEFQPVVIVTAQHREMLDQVLAQFNLRPDHDLNVMRPRQSLTAVTVRMLSELDKVLFQEQPDVVLVHGDTATTFAGALAAFYGRFPVGHVEAGLRTYRKYEPFPEELFRRLTDAIADIHFAPTEKSRANLLAENIPANNIFVTGNTAIDALLQTVDKDYQFQDEMLARLPFDEAAVVVVEAHRRENWGEPMHNICRALRTVVLERRDIQLFFSVHRNPEVVDVVEQYLAGLPRVYLSDPLEYVEWANLMARCRFIVTDSGGLQEEAPALGKPVLLLRNTTERPEAIAAGTVWQVGTDPEAIIAAINTLMDDAEKYEAMAKATNPFGDGKAAKRTIDGLAYWLGVSSQLPEQWTGLVTAG